LLWKRFGKRPLARPRSRQANNIMMNYMNTGNKGLVEIDPRLCEILHYWRWTNWAPYLEDRFAVQTSYDGILSITLAVRSKAWNVFGRSTVGSNPTQGMYVWLYFVFVCR
jgi:hypothetical protein